MGNGKWQVGSDNLGVLVFVFNRFLIILFQHNIKYKIQTNKYNTNPPEIHKKIL